MKNAIVCSSCSASNPPFEYICKNCNSFIRSRVSNIDLWKTTGLLVESPMKAFTEIVFSEHKNFVVFILLLASSKLLVDIRFVSLLTVGEFHPTTSLLFSYLIVVAVILLFLLFYSFLMKFTLQSYEIETRFRDNLAVLIYSLIPHVFGIIFLFVLELVVFGDFLFSVNPSPFVIKGMIAYLFLGAEVLLFLWSAFLSYSAFRVQTSSIHISIMFTFILYILLSTILYFSSSIMFQL